MEQITQFCKSKTEAPRAVHFVWLNELRNTFYFITQLYKLQKHLKLMRNFD